MLAILDPRTRLDRPRYLAWGIGLFAVKLAVDRYVAAQFGREFTPMWYLSPPDSPLMAPGADLSLWLSLWAAALPFLVLGLLLTARRLRDAGLPSWMLLLFFAPFANLLFFLGMAAMPPRDAPGRITATEASRLRAVTAGALAGGTVALGAVAISVGALHTYGAGLFLGSPAIAGFVAAAVFGRLHPSSLVLAVTSSLGALGLAYGVLALFALEGLVCLLMAFPLAASAAVAGGMVAHLMSCAPAGEVSVVPAVVLLPALLATEWVAPGAPPPFLPVESVCEVEAPPEVVWRHVIAFDPLDPPEHWLFRAGVAAPTGAVIEGEGVGAVRRCRFTTGEFVEPITAWEPGRHLGFGVTAMPDPLREWTFWPGPRPPHLDGYLEVERGEFRLEALPGGRTRLVGRTWYRVRVYPQAYWRAWSDYVIGRIHARVLDAIATRSAAAR